MAFKIAAAPVMRPQADTVFSRLLPVATTAAAAMLSIQPVHIPANAALAPAFMLMVVYHWAIYRPDLLPPLAVFLIGVAHDLLAGGVLGVTALLLLLARAVVMRYRRWFPDRTFPFVWGSFSLLAAVAMLGLWMLDSLLQAEAVEFQSTVFRAILTISLFPIASFLLGRTQRALMGAS
jgi:rod shape-determining protein MreD